MARLEVRYEDWRREPDVDAIVLGLTVWDAAEMVFVLSVIVPNEALTAVRHQVQNLADVEDVTFRAAAVWAARELETHGVDRYGRLTSEDGSTGEMRAESDGVAELAGRQLPTLVSGSVVHVFELDFASRMAALLDPLDDFSRQVMTLRFGFDRGEPRTLEEVGEEIGLSRTEVREIERTAMAKLRGQADNEAPELETD